MPLGMNLPRCTRVWPDLTARALSHRSDAFCAVRVYINMERRCGLFLISPKGELHDTVSQPGK